MARRRDPGMVSFDVSYDVAPGADGTPEGDAPGAPPEGPPHRRLGERWRGANPRHRRRAVVLVGGLVVLGAGGVTATTAVSAHAEAQRLREAPGGVLSLEGRLAETARTDVDDLAAVLPGGVLAVVDGDDVVGWDVAGGRERWRTEVGTEPLCGPRPQLGGAVDFATPVSTITCLHDDASAVTVLTQDGQVSGTRDLDAADYGRDHPALLPAADGGLLVVEHDLGLPATVEIPESENDDPWTYLGELGLEPTRTGNAHVEDALTGDVRFAMPLSEPPSGEVANCYDTFSTNIPDLGQPEATLQGPTTIATVHLVSVDQCGARAAATASGTPLPIDLLEGVGYYEDGWLHGSGGIQIGGDGTYVLSDMAMGRVLDADGELVMREASHLLAPAATDGSPADLWVGTEYDQATVAYDLDGEEVWRADGGEVSLVARTADTVVVVAREDVVALDAADGAERWRTTLGEGAAAGEPLSGDVFALAMVTDGARVALMVQNYSGSGPPTYVLVTLDLGTGEHEELPVDLGDEYAPEDLALPWLAAVDGVPVLLEVGYAEDGGYRIASVRTLGAE